MRRAGGAARDPDALAVQLLPELVRSMDAEVLLVHAPDLGLEELVVRRTLRRRAAAGRPVGGGGKLRDPADGLDPEATAARFGPRRHSFRPPGAITILQLAAFSPGRSADDAVNLQNGFLVDSVSSRKAA